MQDTLKDDEGPRLGVYGFAVQGIAPRAQLMVPVDPSAPTLGVHRVADNSCFRGLSNYVRSGLVGGGEVGMNLESGDAYYVLPRDIPDDEMLHPWLAPAVIWRAHLVGRFVIHGGLVAIGTRAVAVVGQREAGKSSLTAWAATSGAFSVLADDSIVVEGRRVFAGPRCIDLRPSALSLFEKRVPMTPARDRTRYRVDLPPCSSVAELIGIVVLSWGPELAFRRVEPTARLPLLLEHLAVIETDRPTTDRLLDLAAIPTWILERPRDFGMLDQTLDCLAKIFDGPLT